MRLRRVKITGLGFVTPAGIGYNAFLRGILNPISYVTVLNGFSADAGAFVGAEVKRFRASDYSADPKVKSLPRHTQFALTAAKMALMHAGIDLHQLNEKAPAVIIGASLMDSEIISKTIENVERKGPRFGLARVIFQAPVSSISSEVARFIGGKVRTLALQSSCCSGVDAIGHAAELIARGESDLAICGGTEAPLVYHPMLELKLAGLSPATNERPDQLCRPFDLWRTTGVIGEGACILVLEPEESSRRGYAWVAGYGYASDCNGNTAEGLAYSMRLALSNAYKRASEVDVFNCWGPGHRLIDAAEVLALQSVFGREAANIAAFSIKGAIGNPLAASGAIQVGCSALCMDEGMIPPTVNWVHRDPLCRLNLSNHARHVGGKVTLVNSHGLAGTNACLILERCN